MGYGQGHPAQQATLSPLQEKAATPVSERPSIPAGNSSPGE